MPYIIVEGERHQLEALKCFFDEHHDELAFSTEGVMDWLSYEDLAKYWGVPQEESAKIGCGAFDYIRFQEDELHWNTLTTPGPYKYLEEGIKLDHEVLTWVDVWEGPCLDVLKMIQDKFPGIKIFFMAELTEAGCYRPIMTNDAKGRYFPARYVLYNCDYTYIWREVDDFFEFRSFGELADFVKEHYGEIITDDDDITRLNNRERPEDVTKSFEIYKVKICDL